MTRDQILESKDVSIYKRLLRVLGDYKEAHAGTDIDDYFDRLTSPKGIKMLPKDKHALVILDCVLKGPSVPGIIQKLFNCRFASLPICVKPMYKVGRRTRVASWTRGMYVTDMVKELIDWEGKGRGSWTDIDSNKVTLLDLTKDKEEK
jgi:hypothetical protein